MKIFIPQNRANNMKLFLLSIVSALALMPYFYTSLIAADSACSLSSSSSSNNNVGVSSTNAFWKGIDGAQFIVELTDRNETRFIQNNTNVFVMYYTTRCSNSQKSKRGFAGAAKQLNSTNPDVILASADCDKQRWACYVKDHQMYYVPTFYLYKDGEWNDQYKGNWTTQAFVQYVNKKLQED